MPLAKLMWTAVIWALGLGPVSLMAHGVPSKFSPLLMGTQAQRQRAAQR
jgi:hypothetical protein